MSNPNQGGTATKAAPRRKIIISERDNIAALMEGDKAIEFIINRGEMLLGDVYLAQVENILPSIDAGFVNVGGDKMGFLHSSDVQGRGELKTRLKPRQRLIVQVIKEPTGHKGPRVTTNISLPGRFLVLMPGSRGVSVSRKIETQQERSRLKSICSLVKASGIGVIVRTEAAGQTESDILEDFEVLLERWQNVVTMADGGDPPTLLYRDQDLIYRVVRELVTEHVDELVIDTAFGAQRAQQLLQNWNLDKTLSVQQYTGQQSIMVAKGVEREIRQALQTKVPLPSGGYLYIQPTEALAVVDVNSGRFTSLSSQSETIRITNLESCREIARQLRLRNIGGMIVCDFIDMESRADQLSILQAFENELAPDKAKPQVGQLTDLGLVEMTRHRQGQALSEIFGDEVSKSTDGNIEFNWVSTTADVPDYRLTGRRIPRSSNAKGGGGKDRNDRNDKDRNSSRNRDDKFQNGKKDDNASEKSGRGDRNEGRQSRSSSREDVKQDPKLDAKLDAKVENKQEPKSEQKRGERRPRRDEKPPMQPGDALYLKGYDDKANIEPDYAELLGEESLSTLNALFSKTAPLGFPPRAVHQTLMRYNAKNTNFMTLLTSFLQRDLERAERQARREAGGIEEDVFDNEDDADLDESQDNESDNDEGGEEAFSSEDETQTSSADTAPVILALPVEEVTANQTEQVLKAVDTAAKPVLLAKLAEQLQHREGEAPAQATPAHDASHLIQEVVLPFVEALRHAEDTEGKKTASHRFLLDVSRMTPADKVMNDDVQNALNTSALEQLGIPEVPMPFDFEGDQSLLNQLVEVAESVVAEEAPTPVKKAKVAETPLEEPLALQAPDEDGDDDDDDDESIDKASTAGVSSANLDELIKRKRHALNKQSGLKPKKRTAQNHKKKKK
ncbi:MAG: Rne/Rng family ribonuclease [Vampirovibrionales bacterium]